MAAREWGIPPWELERTAPALWMERRALFADAEAERMNQAFKGS